MEAAARSQEEVAEMLLSSYQGLASHQISSPCCTSMCISLVVLVEKGPKQSQNDSEALAGARRGGGGTNVVPASLCSEGTGRGGGILERSTQFHIWSWRQAFGFGQQWDVVPKAEEQR